MQFHDQQEMLTYYGYDATEYDQKFNERLHIEEQAKNNYHDFHAHKIDAKKYALDRIKFLKELEANRAWFHPEHQLTLKQIDDLNPWTHWGKVGVNA